MLSRKAKTLEYLSLGRLALRAMSRSFSSWRVLAEGEMFIYDHTDNPAVPNKGYALQVQFRDHEKCNCSRSQPFTLYRPHDPSTGVWPNNYLETEACVAQLFADSPTLKAADGCGSSASYGWIECCHNPGFSLCIMASTGGIWLTRR